MTKMKNWTWQQIFDFQRDNRDCTYTKALDEMPKKYRSAFAAALSVAKWRPDNPNRGSGDCGMCSLYDKESDCSTCPLKAVDRDCNEEGSLFDLVRTLKSHKKSTKQAMDNLYGVLLKIYKEAWEKI